MSQAKTGILLANLGTPEAPTPAAVKRYLRQFLSDTRVVDTPRLLWWPLLRGVILPIRSPRVAKLYQSVWMEEGSPLMVYSRRQEKALAARLPDMPVALGMSYGKPSPKAPSTRWRRALNTLWCWPFIRSIRAPRWLPSGTNWHAFWRPAAVYRASPLSATTPITSCTFRRLPAARARRLKNTASRICCCSPITVFRSVSRTKGTITPALPRYHPRAGLRPRPAA